MCTMFCSRARWWRWVIAVVVCIHYVLVYGPLYNYSILFVSLQKEFNSTAVLAGWPGSTGNAVTHLASPFTALLLPRMTSRYMVILGYVIICAGTLLTSIIPALAYAILTYGVLVGVGTNFVVHAGTALVLELFRKKNFGRANAIIVLGSSFGMLAFSPLISSCINHYGWRRALRYIPAGVLALGLVAGWILMDVPNRDGHERVSSRLEEQSGENTKEQIALNEVETLGPDAPPEKTSVEEKDCQDFQERRGNHRKDSAERSHRVTGSTAWCCRSEWEVFHMMKQVDPWAWTLGTFLATMGWTFFIVNFASFMDRRGLSIDQIPIVIVFFAVGEIGGKVLIGVIGDHFPVQRIYVLAASMLVGTVGVGFMTVVETFPQMIALSILLSGLTRSVLYGMSNAVAADLFRSSYSSNGVMVLCNFPYGIGLLLGGLLSGGLYDITGDYVLSLIVVAALFLCSSATLLFIPIRRRIRSRGSCCYSKEAHPVKL